jgi:hypothetical protein
MWLVNARELACILTRRRDSRYAWKVECIVEVASMLPDAVIWTDASGRVLSNGVELLTAKLQATELHIGYTGG